MFFGIKHNNTTGLITEEILPTFTVPLGPMDTNTHNKHPIDECESWPDLNISVKKRGKGKRKEPPTDSDIYMKKYQPDDLDALYMKDPFKMIDLPPITTGEKMNDIDDSIEDNSKILEELPKNLDTRLAHPYDIDEELKAVEPLTNIEIDSFVKAIKDREELVAPLKRSGYYCSAIDEKYISGTDYQLLKQSHISLHQRSKDILSRWYKGHIGVKICECCRILDIWPAAHKIEVWCKSCPFCSSKKGAKLLNIVEENAAKEKAHLGLSHHTTLYFMY